MKERKWKGKQRSGSGDVSRRVATSSSLPQHLGDLLVTRFRTFLGILVIVQQRDMYHLHILVESISRGMELRNLNPIRYSCTLTFPAKIPADIPLQVDSFPRDVASSNVSVTTP